MIRNVSLIGLRFTLSAGPLCTRAADFYQAAPVFLASQVLPSPLLRGPYKVEPTVRNDGVMNHYCARQSLEEEEESPSDVSHRKPLTATRRVRVPSR